MPTAEKTAVIEKTKEWYGQSSGMIFTDYRGLSVPQIQSLRQSLREAGGEYHVVKNTLLRIALGSDIELLPEELHNGPTATAFIFRDESNCAKLLVKFAKDHKGFEIKGAVFEGKTMTASDVEAFSKLPGKQELLAMIVGLVQAPIAQTVGVLNEIISAPIRLLDAIAEKGGAPAPAAETAQAPSETAQAPTEPEASAQAEAETPAPTEETPATEEEQKEGQE